MDEWRYGAMRRVDAAEEAAEDDATRRLRRNAALMAEVMTPVSNDDDDDSSKNDRSKVDSTAETLDTRVARLRAAVDVTSDDDDAGVLQETLQGGRRGGVRVTPGASRRSRDKKNRLKRRRTHSPNAFPNRLRVQPRLRTNGRRARRRSRRSRAAPSYPRGGPRRSISL